MARKKKITKETEEKQLDAIYDATYKARGIIKWIAVDKDGEVYAYQKEPYIEDNDDMGSWCFVDGDDPICVEDIDLSFLAGDNWSKEKSKIKIDEIKPTQVFLTADESTKVVTEMIKGFYGPFADPCEGINKLCELACETATSKGWHDKTPEFGTIVALMHQELSEALEWARQGNPPSDHIPEFSGVEEELADVLIRIFDYAGWAKLNLGAAVKAKMEFNKGRAYKHGGKEF